MSRYLLALLLILPACKITLPHPNPTPKPPVNCLTHPSCPEGEHCEQGIGCVKDPIPDPEPIECKPGEIPVIVDGEVQRCDPKPAERCTVVESQLEGVPTAVMPVYGDLVAQSMSKLGDPTGKPPQETLDRLAAEIRAQGHCAFGGIEAVFIERPDKLFEEWHSVFFGTGGWTNSGKGKYMLSHFVKSTSPTDPAPPANGCPAPPCPLRVWTAETLPPGWGQDAIGTPAWKLKCKPHGRDKVDCTPVTDRQEPYCRKIGMSPDGDGKLKAACPMRPDGHPQRAEVEAWVTGGTKLEGPGCEFVDGNPMQYFQAGGKCRLCSADGLTCGGWF